MTYQIDEYALQADEHALMILEERWGIDPDQPLGRLAMVLREDDRFGDFVDALAGGEDVFIPEPDLHAALDALERELSYEQVAVALGEAPGRGSLSPAEFLAAIVNEMLAV